MVIYSRISFKSFVFIHFIAALLLFPPFVSSAQDSDQILEYQPEASMAMGWNSLTNRPSNARANCLDPSSYEISDEPREESGGSGIRAEGNFQLIFSKSEIADGFGLNAAASYRSLAYNVSGSAEYAQSKQVSTENTNVAGYVKVETRAQSLRGKSGVAELRSFSLSDTNLPADSLGARLSGIRLSQEALDALKNSPEEFFNNCGDGFVIDIYYGGRLNVIASLSSTSEQEKRKLESSLKGSGGGAEVSIDGFIESAKSTAVESFNASYLMVGTDGGDINVLTVAELKTTFDNFPGNVKKNDIGVRLRVASYASLLPESERYRFGPTDEVIKAARLYNDLESVWRNLADMRGALNKKLRWDLAVNERCLSDKQDEIGAFNSTVLKNITACAEQTTSSFSTPSICESDAFPANPAKNSDPSCPSTTAIVDGQLSQFDYRLFYPMLVVNNELPACKQYDTAEVQAVVRKQWLKPVIDAQCNDNINLPQCNNEIRRQLVNNIHVVDTTKPLAPYGKNGYLSSCQDCKMKWGSGGKAIIQCSCSKNKKYKNTAWINMQCPQKTALQNCNRRLRYGKCK